MNHTTLKNLTLPILEVFIETVSPDILALSETNFVDSIDSGNFSETSSLPLIRKYPLTHMYGLAVYVFIFYKTDLHNTRTKNKLNKHTIEPYLIFCDQIQGAVFTFLLYIKILFTIFSSRN